MEKVEKVTKELELKLAHELENMLSSYNSKHYSSMAEYASRVSNLAHTINSIKYNF